MIGGKCYGIRKEVWCATRTGVVTPASYYGSFQSEHKILIEMEGMPEDKNCYRSVSKGIRRSSSSQSQKINGVTFTTCYWRPMFAFILVTDGRVCIQVGRIFL